MRGSNPEAAQEIATRTRIAGSMHSATVSAAVGSIGGVAPGPYRGSDGWDCGSWDSDDWDCGFYLGGSWCWWSWPVYWSCFYPYWWWSSQPYYYWDYYYYPACTTSVIYPAETQVVYVQEPAYQVNEPVGEAVVPAEPERGRPAGPPLSIVAQRYLELGDRAFREGRYTDAVQFYAKAVEFAPDQGALYLVLADALFAAGDYHYGAYAIRRALELDPSLAESSVDKHGFYPDPATFDQQIETLERYLAEHPSDRDARLVLALNHLFAGRPADARRTIEGSALADDPAVQMILARALAGS